MTPRELVVNRKLRSSATGLARANPNWDPGQESAKAAGILPDPADTVIPVARRRKLARYESLLPLICPVADLN